MSLNSLLESANPYQSLQSDAAKLAGKWEKTGLLEGLEGTTKNNMSIILENQAKQLVVEESNTGGGQGAGKDQEKGRAAYESRDQEIFNKMLRQKRLHCVNCLQVTKH